jgi:hypothetical protein
MLSEDYKNKLKEIVKYNREIIEDHNGDINSALNKIIYFNFEEYTIWNPLLDVSGRYEVDPVKEYSKSLIEEFIDNYMKAN